MPSNYVVARPGDVKIGAVGSLEAAAVDVGSTRDAKFAVSRKEDIATSTKHKGARMEVFFSDKAATLDLTLEEIKHENVEVAFGATESSGTVTDADLDAPTYYAVWVHGFKIDGDAKILHIYRAAATPEAELSLDGSQQYLPLKFVAYQDENESALYEWVPDTADTTAPTVSSSSPAKGGTNFSKTGALTMLFSEAIRSEDVTSEHFALTKEDGTVVAGALTVSSDNLTVTFTPTSSLSGTTNYVWICTAGIRDVAGNKLAAPWIAHFGTAA